MLVVQRKRLVVSVTLWQKTKLKSVLRRFHGLSIRASEEERKNTGNLPAQVCVEEQPLAPQAMERVGNTIWCKCSHCTEMPTENESI